MIPKKRCSSGLDCIFHITGLLKYLYFLCILLSVSSCAKKQQTFFKSVSKKLVFDTAYHQFYILDKGSDGDTGGDFWSESTSANRVAVSNRLVGIKTESYGRIQTSVAIMEKQPVVRDLSKFDHVVEVSLKVESGVIQIADCPNFAIKKEMEVPNGNYRIRVYSANLEGVTEDDGDDFYEIEIWPSEDLLVRVLKRFHP